MNDSINRLDVLQSLLRAPIQVSEFKRQTFPERWTTAEEVIVTHRFIIVLKGSMCYRVEGVTRRVTAGMQVFVPAWSRRGWTLPKGAGECTLLWCSFSSSPVTLPAVLCWRRMARFRSEVTAFEAMRKTIGPSSSERAVTLLIEGELKACLSRFWTEAKVDGRELLRERPVHREVARATTWLERHYTEPDALDAFYRTVQMSPNHFRLLLRQETGETVQAILARLRLRRARYLVQETMMPMKRIAAETGFADPLYFSNQYRRFWGRPATEDRVVSGAA